MNRLFTCIAVALAVVVSAGSAQAATMAMSINFTNGGNHLGAADQAGIDGYANWNNIDDQRGAPGNTQYRSTGPSTGTLLLSDGTVLTDTYIDSFTQGSSNSWNDSPPAVVNAGAYAGTATLWATGVRNYKNAGPDTITISGLAAIFPNGFDVVSYQDYSANSTSSGTISVLGDGVDNYSGNFDTANTLGFNNDFGSFGHAVTLSINPGTDVIEISDNVTGGSNTFAQMTWLGVQIVGETAAVPEPSTFALAGIGLVGLVGFGLRRRRKNA